jgi:hypothetical protein
VWASKKLYKFPSEELAHAAILDAWLKEEKYKGNNTQQLAHSRVSVESKVPGASADAEVDACEADAESESDVMLAPPKMLPIFPRPTNENAATAAKRARTCFSAANVTNDLMTIAQRSRADAAKLVAKLTKAVRTLFIQLYMYLVPRCRGAGTWATEEARGLAAARTRQRPRQRSSGAQ